MSFPPFEPHILWRFLNGSQEAYCVLQPHPTQGLEVQYVFNGVQLIGVVSSDVDELQERAEQWRIRLLADGWRMAERRIDRLVQPTSVRVHRAGAKA